MYILEADEQLRVLAAAVDRLRGAEAHVLVARLQRPVGRPAHHLPPEAVMVQVADALTPAPGAVYADVQHSAESVILPGDQGVPSLPRRRVERINRPLRLERQRRGRGLGLANDAPVRDAAIPPIR